MTIKELEEEYRKRRDGILVPLATRLETHVKELVSGYPRIDRISARAKGLDRFLEKARKTENGKPKYSEPLGQIQDQVGVRIVTFYLSDVESLSKLVEGYLAHIELQKIVPDSPSEFGYEGKHYIFFIPDDIKDFAVQEHEQPTFFELQIKTLFQHAWSEADHDLAYKPITGLNVDQIRRVAFTAAQAWGADRIFDELAQELISKA